MTDEPPSVLPEITLTRPRGRRVDPKLPRGGQIWMRCTDPERQLWEGKARRLGITVSAWIRMVLLQNDDRDLKP